MNIKTTDEKFQTVIQNNTYYFFNKEFEEEYEGYISSVKEILLYLKNEIENRGLKKEIFEKVLVEKENGLIALLALTGFSNENLKRITTLIRVSNDEELSNLVLKNEWYEDESIENISEWGDSKINKMIKRNEFFRKGLVNLFFEGGTVPFLTRTMPLFELKKLSIAKLNFELPELIDTIVRYKEKGSYSGNKQNNPERVIENILNRLVITFESGDLREWIDLESDTKRTMDFIIPNKANPKIVIESSYLVTTSSGQGDKSKTEISIKSLLAKHFPECKFIGFVDGIGWYVRKGDLKRMVTAYEDVFTFNKGELERFERFLIENLKNE